MDTTNLHKMSFAKEYGRHLTNRCTGPQNNCYFCTPCSLASLSPPRLSKTAVILGPVISALDDSPRKYKLSMLENIYEDHQGYIRKIFSNGASLEVEFIRQDWEKSNGYRVIKFQFKNTHYSNLTIGPCGWIKEVKKGNPLNDYHLNKCDVYINSPPKNVVEAFNRFYEVKKEYYGTLKIEDNEIFYGSINAFQRGRGLLSKCNEDFARVLIEKFKDCDLSIIKSNYIIDKCAIMFIFENGHVVCEDCKYFEIENVVNSEIPEWFMRD